MNKWMDEKKPFSIRQIGLPKLFIMLLAGIVLLILSFPDFFSTQKKEQQLEQKQPEVSGMVSGSVDAYVENAENRLRVLLQKIDGAGEVEVMITVKTTGESIPLKDTPYEKSSEYSVDNRQENIKESAEESTVMVEKEDGSKVPYVVAQTVPEIEGVAVIAQGGGNKQVKQEIIGAVQVLFDIQAHKIKVMKMDNSSAIQQK